MMRRKQAKELNIETITGKIVVTDGLFDVNPIPDNWIWGDMGNYYGAGHWALNWGENQYDLSISSGRTCFLAGRSFFTGAAALPVVEVLATCEVDAEDMMLELGQVMLVCTTTHEAIRGSTHCELGVFAD